MNQPADTNEPDEQHPEEAPASAEADEGHTGAAAPEPAAGSTPALGSDEAGWGGPELVESVYAPLSEFYARIDARLREMPGDVQPVGWAPHLAALRALREQRVAGDWETLARFLVAPGSLDETDTLRLVQVAEGDAEGDEVEAVRRTIKELAASDARALLIAPTPEQAADVLRSLEDDPEVFSLLIETRPETAEARSVRTQVLPPVEEPPAAEHPAGSPVADEATPLPPPVREHGSTGTVEFRPLSRPAGEGESASAVTRAEPLPALPPEPVEDDPSAATQAAPIPPLPPEPDGADDASAATQAAPLPPEAGDDASTGTQAGHSATPPEGGEGGEPSALTAPPPVMPLEGTEGGASGVTRADAGPPTPPEDVTPAVPEEGPSAPETRVRSAALRPVGEAWRQAWETEVRLLRRGLLALEQWPRDAAALRSAQAEHLRRGEELEAEQAALRAGIEEARKAAAEAERAAEEADAEAERLAAVQEAAEVELVEPRAEADRLQREADQAADEATARTRTADASYARCVQLDERAKTAQSELQGAREAEASLTDELTRAREALPAAAEEAHRLTAADADAAAEGHAAYYRLVSAESALSAVRRKMTLGQRLHVASPPAELRSLRAEVKARTREADEAAKRAQEAKDAAEHAERVRRGLASFVSEGGARLRQAQEAQERLGTELTWLAAEREKATAEHREHARLATEAVERAREAGLRARAAHQVAQEIEDRVTAARTAREEALAAAARARAGAEAASAQAEETAAALERRTAEAAEEAALREADLEIAARTEARTRENVAEICGADPAEDPEAIPAHQRRAMARIEQLTGYLEGGRTVEGDVLLRTADLVVGTPLGAALAAPDQEFDALVVAGAGALTDAEFLIGAVRTHRWILVGAPGSRPPEYREYADGPSDRLERSPFERATTEG